MMNKDLILQISKELGLTHIGSNLSCLPILEEIYAHKKLEDIVILDNAHAHLAHLLIKTVSGELDIRKTEPIMSIRQYGIHCDRQAGCDASGGSLGHGIGIAIGYCLVNRERDVYVIVSDGSMQEGSNWEALRIANQLRLDNLHIRGNFNGYTAVAKINRTELADRIHACTPKIDFIWYATDNTEEFDGVQGHYKKLT